MRIEKAGGGEEFVFVAGGILDEAKAQSAKQAAEELMQSQDAQIDYAKAQAELASAIAQLAAIQRLRSKGGKSSACHQKGSASALPFFSPVPFMSHLRQTGSLMSINTRMVAQQHCTPGG